MARLTIICWLVGCQGGAPAPVAPVATGDNGLSNPAEVEAALDRAQTAYMEGRWGDAVVEATRVTEGAASPEEYYMAVKILGLASCNRKDPRPVAFAWKRLHPADQASLRNECEQHGLSISEDGVVTAR
jgi:hypothetical protein